MEFKYVLRFNAVILSMYHIAEIFVAEPICRRKLLNRNLISTKERCLEVRFQYEAVEAHTWGS